MLAPRHLIFTALEGALVDPATDSFAGAEDAISELDRRKIAYVLLTSRTRAEIEPIRRKLGHNHPFVTESGGGIYFPDGYFSVRIPGVIRVGRYLSIALGKPYAEVCEALEDIAEATGVGVTGFHDMSVREIADNTGLRLRDAELARAREFDEPFYFTSADDQAVARFVEAARTRGFATRRDGTFWHLSSGCDPAKAVRTVTRLFREATRSNLRAVGIGAGQEDTTWLRACDQAVVLQAEQQGASADKPAYHDQGPKRGKVTMSGLTGPDSWDEAILNIIGQS